MERFERINGFAAAARLVHIKRQINPAAAVPLPAPPHASGSATAIQATLHNHSTCDLVQRLCPTATACSNEGDMPDDIPEEIHDDDATEDPEVKALASKMAMTMSDEPERCDSALERSGELETSCDSVTLPSPPEARVSPPLERICAICLGDMPRHRRRPGPMQEAAPATVVTLECWHKFHRRCLLEWCRSRPSGGCPICRVPVQVRLRKLSSPDPAAEAQLTCRPCTPSTNASN